MALTPEQLSYKGGVVAGIAMYQLNWTPQMQQNTNNTPEGKRLFLLGLAQGIHEAHYGQGGTPADLVYDFVISDKVDFQPIGEGNKRDTARMFDRFSGAALLIHKDA